MKRELQIEELAPYIPYELKVHSANTEIYSSDNIWELEGVVRNNVYLKELTYPADIFAIKPILTPLSSLTSNHPAMIEINLSHTVEYNMGNTFVEPENEYDSDPYSVDWLPNKCFQILIKHHVDVFELIPAGLAIDITTLTS